MRILKKEKPSGFSFLLYIKLLHILQPLLETLHIAPVKKLGQLFVLPLVDGLKVHSGLLFLVILQWTHLL